MEEKDFLIVDLNGLDGALRALTAASDLIHICGEKTSCDLLVAESGQEIAEMSDLPRFVFTGPESEGGEETESKESGVGKLLGFAKRAINAVKLGPEALIVAKRIKQNKYDSAYALGSGGPRRAHRQSVGLRRHHRLRAVGGKRRRGARALQPRVSVSGQMPVFACAQTHRALFRKNRSAFVAAAFRLSVRQRAPRFFAVGSLCRRRRRSRGRGSRRAGRKMPNGGRVLPRRSRICRRARSGFQLRRDSGRSIDARIRGALSTRRSRHRRRLRADFRRRDRSRRRVSDRSSRRPAAVANRRLAGRFSRRGESEARSVDCDNARDRRSQAKIGDPRRVARGQARTGARQARGKIAEIRGRLRACNCAIDFRARRVFAGDLPAFAVRARAGERATNAVARISRFRAVIRRASKRNLAARGFGRRGRGGRRDCCAVSPPRDRICRWC